MKLAVNAICLLEFQDCRLTAGDFLQFSLLPFTQRRAKLLQAVRQSLQGLFGFDLMRNFNFPYFSRDIAEFWRRWHISLSTWFRDYVYIPLGGSQGGTLAVAFLTYTFTYIFSSHYVSGHDV